MDRIKFLASLTKGSKILADVGCDHAYTLIESIKNQGVLQALAIDIGEKPLLSAKSNVMKAGLLDKVKFIKSNGLLNVSDYFDTVLISGMGGILITKILNDSYDKIKNKTLILAPNTDMNLLRKYLSNNNFIIIEEYAIIDSNKYYEIIKAIPGYLKLNDLEIEFGPILLKERPETFLNNIKNKYNNLNNVINNIKNNGDKEKILLKLSIYKEILDGKDLF